MADIDHLHLLLDVPWCSIEAGSGDIMVSYPTVKDLAMEQRIQDIQLHLAMEKLKALNRKRRNTTNRKKKLKGEPQW